MELVNFFVISVCSTVRFGLFDYKCLQSDDLDLKQLVKP